LKVLLGELGQTNHLIWILVGVFFVCTPDSAERPLHTLLRSVLDRIQIVKTDIWYGVILDKHEFNDANSIHDESF